jgi:hypothetical protein
LRRQWLAEGKDHLEEQHFAAFSCSLLLVPEHTWGLDEKKYLADEVSYSAAQFAAARQRPHFQQFEASWEEQRQYLHEALQALQHSPKTAELAQEAMANLAAIEPLRPDMSGFTRVNDVSHYFDTAHFRVQFDAAHGGLCFLQERATGRQWASPEHILALFRYEIFSSADYERFLAQYVPLDQIPWWAIKDLTKPGIEALKIASSSWTPLLSVLSWRHDARGYEFLVEQIMPEEPVTHYGCPRSLFMRLNFPDDDASITIDMQWFEKPACRLPEALWLSFVPSISDVNGWRLEKLGQDISPLEVIHNGNRKLHAVGKGVSYHDTTSHLVLETLDAPLVAPGERSLLNFNNDQPPVEKGIHFNLFNNIYGTNFRMWYDEDARFRFVLKVKSEN